MNTFNIFTLFPDMFKVLDYGILGIAKDKGIIKINTVNTNPNTNTNTINN